MAGKASGVAEVPEVEGLAAVKLAEGTVQGQAGRKLLGKLVEVARELDHVEKNGRNDHHGYDYVKAEDVLSAVRAALVERDVLLVPSSSHARVEGTLVLVDLLYTFHDAETGETLALPWVGVGFDKGGDKAIYKAYTGALKYLFLQTFLIPTGDDPEGDRVTDPSAPVVGRGAADPRVPIARATKIAQRTTELGLDAAEVTRRLVAVGAERISLLTVDQAEAFEAALSEPAPAAEEVKS